MDNGATNVNANVNANVVVKNCTFCRNLQIPGPHDHVIRDFTKPNNPIQCPKLLEIECGYCHEKGHTTKYCHVLKERKNTYSGGNLFKFKISEKKRVKVIDKDGFECIPFRSFENPKVITHNKIQKINTLIGAYAALNFDECDSDIDAVDDAVDTDAVDTDAVDSTKKLSNQELLDRLGITKRRWAEDIDIDDDKDEINKLK
jgi:hypothetical protein